MPQQIKRKTIEVLQAAWRQADAEWDQAIDNDLTGEREAAAAESQAWETYSDACIAAGICVRPGCWETRIARDVLCVNHRRTASPTWDITGGPYHVSVDGTLHSRVDRPQSTTRVKTIAQVERLQNSKDANPRHRVHFTDGTAALTEIDGAVNHQITNPEHQGTPQFVEFDTGGRIVDIKPEEKR